MTSLVIKTRTETLYWMFTRADFAFDALEIFKCDHNDFQWQLNSPLTAPTRGYQP